MKAIQINDYGSRDVMELSESVSTPHPVEEQVLVEVAAAGVNPFDYKMREGSTKTYAPLTFPVTMGGDFAGIVSEVGQGVTAYKIGDEVFGSALILNGGSGSFAQMATARVKNIALKPTNASFEQAAGLPLVGASAVQAIEDHIKLTSGQKILIHGGAGGIGHIAIQIAKAVGAYVITTVSSNDITFVKGLGADKVIDYKNEKFEKKVSDLDAVFDTVGAETLNRSVGVLKKDGILVSMMGRPSEETLLHNEITTIGQVTQTNTQHLTRVKELVDEGKIKVSIDRVFPIDQIKDAFAYLEDIHPKGKVILSIKE
jgi:NADPH:quinone reductase-like Zn-dependent oxidoreductase